jgi:hypothetical protein
LRILHRDFISRDFGATSFYERGFEGRYTTQAPRKPR